MKVAEAYIPEEYKEKYLLANTLPTDPAAINAEILKQAEAFMPEAQKAQYSMAKTMIKNPSRFEE